MRIPGYHAQSVNLGKALYLSEARFAPQSNRDAREAIARGFWKTNGTMHIQLLLQCLAVGHCGYPYPHFTDEKSEA